MALDAYNTLFQIGSGTTTTLATVAEVRNIDAPNYSRTILETSSMDSTSQHRTYIYGFANGGDISIEFEYTPSNTTHQELTDAIVNKDIKYFAINWSDSGTTTNWSGQCLVESFQPTANFDGVLMARANLKVTAVLTVPT